MHSLFECWRYLNVMLLSIFSYNRRRQNCEESKSWSQSGLVWRLVQQCNVEMWKFHCVVPENIHTPPPHGRSWEIPMGRGGFNGSNFQGVRGVYGKYFPKGDGPHTKHWKQCTIDLKHKSEHMYVVLKQKSVLLAAEMRLTSLALMLLFFFELANTTISSRTAMMCLWNEVETIENGGHTLL